MENKEQKNLYELNLHESIVIVVTGEGIPINWQITRVPGGWIYQDIDPKRLSVSEFFVPFNNEYQR